MNCYKTSYLTLSSNELKEMLAMKTLILQSGSDAENRVKAIEEALVEVTKREKEAIRSSRRSLRKLRWQIVSSQGE